MSIDASEVIRLTPAQEQLREEIAANARHARRSRLSRCVARLRGDEPRGFRPAAEVHRGIVYETVGE